LLQFFPGDFELTFGALMVKAIKAHILHQDIQAVNESPSRCSPVISLGCGGSVNTQLLRLPR
jgi:hypothetical protein